MESCIFPWFDRTPCPPRPPIQSVSSTLKKHLWCQHYWKEHSSLLVTFGDPVLISPNLEAVSVVMFYKDPLVWSGSLRSILVSMLFWWSSPSSRVDRSLRVGGLHGSRVWWLSCGRWWQKEAVINSGVSKGSSTKLPWAVRTDEQDKIPHIKCMYMSALSLFWHWLWHRLTVCSELDSCCCVSGLWLCVAACVHLRLRVIHISSPIPNSTHRSSLYQYRIYGKSP